MEREGRRTCVGADAEVEGAILIATGQLDDAEQPEEASQPAEPDGGSPEGIRGSAGDRSQAGAEEAMDLATGRGDDAEQPEDASQPAEPDGGSPEGIRGSAEDRSQRGTEATKHL